jgi:hypothetical protein
VQPMWRGSSKTVIWKVVNLDEDRTKKWKQNNVI